MASRNQYEKAARIAKASKIADVLMASGITRDAMLRADTQDWEMAAAGARVKVPSDETRLLVLSMLDASAYIN